MLYISMKHHAEKSLMTNRNNQWWSRFGHYVYKIKRKFQKHFFTLS